MWLLVTVLSYLFLAIAAFGDKFLISGSITSPKVYSFYVGALSIFVVFLIPFGFYVPPVQQIILALLAGALFMLGLYIYYSLMKEFEISRIAPSIGGFIPILTLLLTFALSKQPLAISQKDILSFILLILGSVLIITTKLKNILGKAFVYSLGTAFYFSIYFVLSKFVYEDLKFVNGFIWIRLGGFLIALFFLFFKEVRKQLSFSPGQGKGIKTTALFLGNQAVGALGSITQSLAISLAPLVFVAFISALQGVQYIFLFLFTVLFSIKLPHLLKEEISKKIIYQKIVSIILIIGGFIILAVK